MKWDDATTDAIVRRLHPENPPCPLCGSHQTYREEAGGCYVEWRAWECRNCGAGFHEE